VDPAILIRHHVLLWNLSTDRELLQRSFRWTPGTPEICCVPSFRFEPFGSVIVACELDRTDDTKAFEKECGMYNAKRDSEGGGASHAIPSMGAIEGRITVLEVLAATSLRLLLKEGDKIAAKHALSSIRKAMRAKCNDVHLSADDSKSALAYVKELMDATLESAEFAGAQSLQDPMLVA